MQNGYVESFNGRMRDELLNESLFFGLDHARSAIAEWATGQQSSPGRTHRSDTRPRQPIAGTIAATGSNASGNMEAPRFRRLLTPRHLAYQKPPRL